MRETPMSLPRQIEYETMLLCRHRDLAVDGGRLERSAYVLLSRLRAEGAMSIGQLSEAFGVARSTIHRQITAAHCAGLVDRIPDPDGGLARKFQVSPEGERRLLEERERILRGLERVLADWPPEDAAAFAGYLKRFNGSIEDISGLRWPRP
ncbi:MarR family winged helix-turn-helix transcriptional regulator [Nonomuraea terrae]|uniref:MarR family winged helix-turn-helix transcriptional regulator n=1 Tax=Nonomuraea terrae TaxID=2530383 RepID=UPI0037BB052F